MEQIECHSGTKKEELIEFVDRYKGKSIEVHFEGNFSSSWGDDYILSYDTSKENRFNILIDTIKNHYIHGLKLNN